MPADPLFYLVVAISVTLIGLAKGGFGPLTSMAAPLLSLVVSPLEAAGILLPILMMGDVIAVWTYRRDWDASNLKVLLPSAFVGIIAGWLLAAYFSDAWLRVALGAIASGFALSHWFGLVARQNSGALHTARGTFWGAVAGFVSYVAHAGGPPFQIHVMPQRLKPQIYAGTAAMFFAAVNLMKVPFYFSLGQLSPFNLTVAFLFLPLAVGTTLVGAWLVRRMSGEIFYRVAYVLVFMLGLELLRAGLAEIFRG